MYRLSVLLPAFAIMLLAAAPAVAADDFADMIGKPAPEMKADFSLGGKPVKLADLKGKVVLLDFWAVWCGPCIRTFPHLRDWNKEFKDKGLEVVGLTSYWEDYGFDKTKGTLVQADKKLTAEQEQAMLKDFATYHKLEHALAMVPQKEWESLSKAFKVTGIPHVVLIDRKGNVRMVRVGSGEENAKALEEMIKKLVAEKE